MTIAKLLGGFEVAKCRAEAHAAKLFGALTDGRRESMDATIHDAQFYSERYALHVEAGTLSVSDCSHYHTTDLCHACVNVQMPHN